MFEREGRGGSRSERRHRAARETEERLLSGVCAKKSAGVEPLTGKVWVLKHPHPLRVRRPCPFWQSMLHDFLSRPLSFLGWTTAMLFWLDFHKTQSNLYKWFRMQRTTGLQRAQKNPCYTSLHLIALATSGSSHQVQDTDACIQNDHRLSTLLLPLTITNLHPLQKSEIC